jgi:hypothetical protein
MRSICFVIFYMILCNAAILAQNKGTVEGIVYDSSAKKNIANATVTVMNKKDSSLVSFGMTDGTGRFYISGLSNGAFRLLVTHVNYHSSSNYFLIDHASKHIDIGKIAMIDQAKLLEEVTVKAEAPPVALIGDTIQYNAGSFKVAPNSSVENLLKKLPGIEVAKDGTITAHGKNVDRVRVDGREFFGNDTRIATKNLPADIVDKVQVYDDMSEQAKLTGFDDGNSTKTINLKLKSDKKNGLFGKVTAGGGTADRYEGKGNLNLFKGIKQLSVIGLGNNINEDAFTLQGGDNTVTGNLKGADKGINVISGGGFNYNDAIGSKTDFTSNYFFSRAGQVNESYSRRQYYLPGSSYLLEENENSNNRVNSHLLNLTANYSIDSFHSIRVSPSLDYNNGHVNISGDYLQSAENYIPQNRGHQESEGNTSGYNFRNGLIFRKKFRRRGRTFSINVNTVLEKNINSAKLKSINFYFDRNGLPLSTDKDSILQHGQGKIPKRGYDLQINYTEPIFRQSLLEVNFNNSLERTELEALTHDYNRATASYDSINERQSSDFINTSKLITAGLRLHKRQKRYSYSLGVNLQHTGLQRKVIAGAKNSAINKRSFTFLPNVRFQYNFKKSKRIGLEYSPTTRQPTVAQLQPVSVIRRLPDIRRGNPDLKQEYIHSVQLKYSEVNVFRGKTFFAFIAASQTNNRITDYDSLDILGNRYSTPVNVNGIYNLTNNINIGLPAAFINGELRINMRASFARDKGFVNGTENKIRRININPRITMDINLGAKADISLSAGGDFSRIKYSLASAKAATFFTQTYEVQFNWQLPEDFYLNTDFTYMINRQPGNDFQTRVPLLNAWISRQMLKYNRGELRLSINDMLNQNIGVYRSVNPQYTEEKRMRTLRRFGLLTFTYNLSKTGLHK